MNWPGGRSARKGEGIGSRIELRGCSHGIRTSNLDPRTSNLQRDALSQIPPRLGRNVIALTLVSFFTDVSSEMIYPLLPVFLTAVLGASASFIGAIEGAAESTSSILKLASGWWSDRIQRRKPLVVFGYALASAMRPLVGLARSAGEVLVIRLSDRVGKGIRNAPRDALIADSIDPSIRGRAFGFHRAGDHAGGVVGPLIAFALMSWWAVPMRQVFLLAAIPGVIAVLVVVVGVREPRARAAGGAWRVTKDDGAANHGAPVSFLAPPTTRNPQRVIARTPLPRGFWLTLGVILVFTLGNSTDAFLLLRATQLGVPAELAPLLWTTLHVVKVLASVPGGALSDRVGRQPTLIAGWLLYGAVYLGFAVASAAWHAWVLFAAYGLFFGLTEGTERALIADIVPRDRRGAAYGWYHLAVGVGMLPASLIFGVVWDRAGASTAFLIGASLSIAAAVSLRAVATRFSTG
jgi:MFS family permease